MLLEHGVLALDESLLLDTLLLELLSFTELVVGSSVGLVASSAYKSCSLMFAIYIHEVIFGLLYCPT